MILIDMSNLAISSIQDAFSGQRKDGATLDETSIRHIVLKKIIDLHKKVGRHHELVLCFDSRNYWRKDYFPYYKGNRKKIDSDTFNWDEFYRLYNEFKVELPFYFPYKCVEVDRCEADDIIYCISEYHKGENIVIASSDTDDLQILEKYPNACQFSFKRNKFITCEDYNYSLESHIIEGDFSDCIPNILSENNTHVNPGVRSKALTKKIRFTLSFGIPKDYEDRYKENKMIIDMSMIPENYKQNIIDEYLKEKPKRLGNSFQYCIKYKLGKLLKHL